MPRSLRSPHSRASRDAVREHLDDRGVLRGLNLYIIIKMTYFTFTDIKSTAYFEIIFHVDYILSKYFRHLSNFIVILLILVELLNVIILCFYINK